MVVNVTFCDGETKVYSGIDDIKFVGNLAECLHLVGKTTLQTLINWNHVKSIQYHRERIQVIDLNMD